jgi:hypothetical protein
MLRHGACQSSQPSVLFTAMVTHPPEAPLFSCTLMLRCHYFCTVMGITIVQLSLLAGWLAGFFLLNK